MKSDFLVLEAIKVEERRRGLGRASSARSELVRLHIVAFNSRFLLFSSRRSTWENIQVLLILSRLIVTPACRFFTSRRSTWENMQGHTQVGEVWRRAVHLSQPAGNPYCCNARPGFVPAGEMLAYFGFSAHHVCQCCFPTLGYNHFDHPPDYNANILLILIL